MDYNKFIKNITSIQELHKIKAELIGQNGIITQKLKNLSKLTLEEKKLQGKEINQEKILIEQLIKEKYNELNSTIFEKIDHSLIFNEKIGLKHIITESVDLLNEIFESLGFDFLKGPDIEKVYYNFDALNITENHPARDNNDTFYISETELLRTHVTAVQIRLLEQMMQNKNNDENIRTYSIGNVYRNDEHDATHSCQFQQIEGIVIEKNANMKTLKGLLEYILEKFFERKVKITFRPSFFPFTEPSCEVYAYTKIENNKLILAQDGNPLEIGGCGIIHPDILKKFEINSPAFAFGMGLERWIMLKYGIKNLHSLYNNHIEELRYIKQ